MKPYLNNRDFILKSDKYLSKLRQNTCRDGI